MCHINIGYCWCLKLFCHWGNGIIVWRSIAVRVIKKHQDKVVPVRNVCDSVTVYDMMITRANTQVHITRRYKTEDIVPLTFKPSRNAICFYWQLGLDITTQECTAGKHQRAWSPGRQCTRRLAVQRPSPGHRPKESRGETRGPTILDRSCPYMELGSSFTSFTYSSRYPSVCMSQKSNFRGSFEVATL